MSLYILSYNALQLSVENLQTRHTWSFRSLKYKMTPAQTFPLRRQLLYILNRQAKLFRPAVRGGVYAQKLSTKSVTTLPADSVVGARQQIKNDKGIKMPRAN